MKSSPHSESIVRTPCRLCRGQCGLKLHIAKNRIVKAEGDRDDPVSRGHICPKGKAIPEILNAPDRLTHPLQRDGNTWKKISWEDAIDRIASELKTVKDIHGAHATAIHMGLEGVIQDIEPLIMRFCNVYGTPNYCSASSQCYWAKEIGNVLTCGSLPIPDVENANCIVVWGANPGASNPLKARDILARQKQGASLMVVDPARTRIAKKADLHLQIKPGTDGALALGMLHIILQKNLYDIDFTTNRTIGFEKIQALCAQYPPQKVEEITWIPRDRIEAAALLYGNNKPGCIIQGNALELHTNAIQAIRAIAILEAVAGNLDIKGGGLIKPLPTFSDMILKEMLPPEPKALGASDYPLFYAFTRNAQANILAETILTETPYPIKAMVITGANPLLTFPNINKVKRALDKLDFLVVMEMFMTQTAKLADIVLPGAAVFERSELWGVAQFQSAKTITYVDKVVQAPEKCRPEWRFWVELAKALGYEKYFPWQDAEALYDFRLETKAITIDKLKRHGKNTIVLGPKEYGTFKKNGFQTPSGKVELYSARMKATGADPLPAIENLAENSHKTAAVTNHYPLILTTGARLLEYIHSRFRNIPSLTKRVPEPSVDIHPKTATDLGIEEGDKVTVATEKGRISLKARVTEIIHPRVVRIATGWNEANVNVLTDDATRDPISGYPSFKSLPCRVAKKTGEKVE